MGHKMVQIPMSDGGDRWGWGKMVDFATFGAESKPVEPQINYVWYGRGRGLTFQLLLLSTNLLKPQIPYVWWGWEQVNLSTFDADSKSAEPQFPYVWWGRGRGLTFNFCCGVQIC